MLLPGEFLPLHRPSPRLEVPQMVRGLARSNALNCAGGYTTALAVGFVLCVFLIVQPIVNLIYRRFRTKGDVADSGLFSALMILMLLVLAFTAEVIGMRNCVVGI